MGPYREMVKWKQAFAFELPSYGVSSTISPSPNPPRAQVRLLYFCFKPKIIGNWRVSTSQGSLVDKNYFMYTRTPVHLSCYASLGKAYPTFSPAQSTAAAAA